MPKPSRLYWDSCAWLGLINGEVDKKRELELIYNSAKSGHCEIWTSTLSMIEVRRLKSETTDPKPLSAENLRVIHNIFRQPFVKPIPLAVDIADDARVIIRETAGLKKWQDAVHLASALRWDTTVMHTYDRDDLLHLTGKFTCRGGEVLTICYPDETSYGPLFRKA